MEFYENKWQQCKNVPVVNGKIMEWIKKSWEYAHTDVCESEDEQQHFGSTEV